MDKTKAAVLTLLVIFFFLGVSSWVESSYEARMVESCVSAGGEWVDVNDSFVVNMGCKR